MASRLELHIQVNWWRTDGEKINDCVPEISEELRDGAMQHIAADIINGIVEGRFTQEIDDVSYECAWDSRSKELA
jgi:hypothetical protein